MRIGIGAAAALLAAALAGAGCGGRDYGWEEGVQKEKAPGEAGAEPAKRAKAAELEKKALASWEKRDEEPALRETIATLAELLEARGGQDYATLVWLSRAHYILGEILIDEEKRLESYETGMKYGDLALNTIPAFRERFEKKQAVEEAVYAVGKEGIEAIYWDAVNIGRWARLKGLTKILFMKDKVKRMVDRVAELDETWFHGAAHRYLGAYYAALAGYAGGDPEKSRAHFERAKAIQPNYLATRVLMAEFLAKRLSDRKMYKAELEFVLKTPPDVLPNVAPEQRIEKRKAKVLLDEIDEHFDEEEGS